MKIALMCAAFALFPLSALAQPPAAAMAAVQQTENEIRAEMRDPQATRFGLVVVVQTSVDGHPSYLVCGHVNGKNAYGSYVGMRNFVGDEIEPPSVDPSLDLSGSLAATQARAAFMQKFGSCIAKNYVYESYGVEPDGTLITDNM